MLVNLYFASIDASVCWVLIYMRYMLFVFLLVVTSAFSESSYIAIFDAGSSGTRLHFYVNDLDEGSGELAVSEIEIAGKSKVAPGISILSNNSVAIANYLNPLLDSLHEVLSSNAIEPENVDVYFLATAGMRLISKKAQKSVYSAVNSAMLAQHLNVKNIRTIAGWEEGFFGWLSINMISGNIQSRERVVNSGIHTLGYLDMGGASTQIVFEVEGSEVGEESASVHSVEIGERNYNLYSKSYLGLGLDRIGIQLKAKPSCFPVGYPMKGGSVGGWDFSSCQKAISSVVSNVSTIPEKSLANISFVGVNGFYYISNMRIFKADGAMLRIEELQQVCKTTWSDFVSAEPDNPYLATACSYGLYLNSLLSRYGFLPADSDFEVKSKVSGVRLSWAYGANVYYAFGGGE